MSEKDSLTNVSSVLERVGLLIGATKDIDIANALGVSRQTVSGWRRRESIPYETLLPFAKERHIPLNYLLWGDDHEQNDQSAETIKTGSNRKINPLSELSGWADTVQMSELLHFIFHELDEELSLQEQMPAEEPFWFITCVYQKVMTHLPDGVLANSEEAYEMAKHFAKEEIEHYNRMLAIARKNTEAREKREK